MVQKYAESSSRNCAGRVYPIKIFEGVYPDGEAVFSHELSKPLIQLFARKSAQIRNLSLDGLALNGESEIVFNGLA